MWIKYEGEVTNFTQGLRTSPALLGVDCIYTLISGFSLSLIIIVRHLQCRLINISIAVFNWDGYQAITNDQMKIKV